MNCCWRTLSIVLVFATTGCSVLLDSKGTGEDAGQPRDGAILSDGAPDASYPETCIAGAFPVVFGASEYRFESEALSWYQARSQCAQLGGHLAVVNNQVEQDFLTVDMAYAGWIGASDHVLDGTFLWTTGAALPLSAGPSPDFRSWAAGQPDELGNNQDCVRTDSAGEWLDEDCRDTFAYVCECDGVTEQPLAWCETGTDAHCRNCSAACQFGSSCLGGQRCSEMP